MPTTPSRPELTWDLVTKRNSVERLKREKAPLRIIDEIPSLIACGYEAIPEEDIVRLRWYGLYHDKPKIGAFMLRVKTPAGALTPAKLRAIGEISAKYGGNSGEITTRQNIQIHGLRLDDLPDIFATIADAGLTTVGACGDTVRNITGCPVSGLDPHELFDAGPVLAEVHRFFHANPEYADLPRKHKITISACGYQCSAPEINCIALVGDVVDGVEGFAIRIGGGLSTVPRLAQDFGVFIPAGDAIPVIRAIIDTWKDNLGSRMSRVKARLKFLVDDLGIEAYRARVEERLGRRLDNGSVPAAIGRTDHVGVVPQKQPGRNYVGFPVNLGLASGGQMRRIADLAEEYGGEIRLTRQQNFILTGVPDDRVDDVAAAVEAIGFLLAANRIRSASIACTGSPLCNFAVAETKTKLGEILDHLEGTFGDRMGDLQIALDGCPHACAHHWIGSIGLQGTTLRERGGEGEKLEAYDIYLRGGLGATAEIGRPVVKRVPSEIVAVVLERIVGAWLDGRTGGESVAAFYRRHSDEEIVAIAGAAPAIAGVAG